MTEESDSSSSMLSLPIQENRKRMERGVLSTSRVATLSSSHGGASPLTKGVPRWSKREKNKWILWGGLREGLGTCC